VKAIDRPKLKGPQADEEAGLLRQGHLTNERFVLQIDGQSKSSYADNEVAMNAGRKIKMRYPVVKAVVYDSKKGTNELC
jgi:hypothetical protein